MKYEIQDKPLLVLINGDHVVKNLDTIRLQRENEGWTHVETVLKPGKKDPSERAGVMRFTRLKKAA